MPGVYDRLVKLATKAGFEPLIIQQAQPINGLLALAAAGLGLALVPDSMRVVRLAGIRHVALEESDAYLLLAAACQVDDDSPALQQFMSTVADAPVARSL